jgi:hypothetical protein
MSDWISGFLNEENVNNLFQHFYNKRFLIPSEQQKFKSFLKFVVDINRTRQSNVVSVNNFVKRSFDTLWPEFSKVYKSENFKQHKDNVEYNHIGATPIEASRPVPYNYDHTLKFNKLSDDTEAYTEDNNIYAGTNPGKKLIEASDEYKYLDKPISSAKDTSLTLASDGGGSLIDANLSFIAPRIKRFTQEYVVVLDSRLRDVQLSPFANSYKMNLTQLINRQYGFVREFENGITNVISIELLQCSIPNIIRDSTLQFYEPYIYLDIKEITGIVRTPIDDPSHVFTHLYYENKDSIRNIPHLTMIASTTKKEYPESNPLNKLNSLTITYHNFHGELYDFGNDAPKISNVLNGPSTIFTTFEPHGLSTSDRVYIRGFITGNDTYDKIVTQAKGWIVAVNSLNTFEIQYDSTGMPVPAAFGNALIAKFQNNLSLRIKAFTTDLS